MLFVVYMPFQPALILTMVLFLLQFYMLPAHAKHTHFPFSI